MKIRKKLMERSARDESVNNGSELLFEVRAAVEFANFKDKRDRRRQKDLKKTIVAWKEKFKAANDGRDATHADIEKDLSILGDYAEYLKLQFETKKKEESIKISLSTIACSFSKLTFTNIINPFEDIAQRRLDLVSEIEKWQKMYFEQFKTMPRDSELRADATIHKILQDLIVNLGVNVRETVKRFKPLIDAYAQKRNGLGSTNSNLVTPPLSRTNNNNNDSRPSADADDGFSPSNIAFFQNQNGEPTHHQHRSTSRGDDDDHDHGFEPLEIGTPRNNRVQRVTSADRQQQNRRNQQGRFGESFAGGEEDVGYQQLQQQQHETNKKLGNRHQSFLKRYDEDEVF